MGIYKRKDPNGHFVAYRDFRRDPEAHPLKTPSGKIEIYSSRLAEIAARWQLEVPAFKCGGVDRQRADNFVFLQLPAGGNLCESAGVDFNFAGRGFERMRFRIDPGTVAAVSVRQNGGERSGAAGLRGSEANGHLQAQRPERPLCRCTSSPSRFATSLRIQ